MPAIILASGSPRRRELLAALGVSFDVVPSGASEVVGKPLSSTALVTTLALRKARHLAVLNHAALVIAADTVIDFQGAPIGKPKTAMHAQKILRALSGRQHDVITGVALICRARHICECFHVTTRVRFRSLTPAEIDQYVASGEPADKAGGYGIQGLGASLVASVEGSFSNVVGLPIHELARRLCAHFGDDSCLPASIADDRYRRALQGREVVRTTWGS